MKYFFKLAYRNSKIRSLFRRNRYALSFVELAILCEDGRALELRNVMYTDKEVTRKINEFVGLDLNPEFFGYNCSAQWFLLCSMFGNASTPPHFLPAYYTDLLRELSDANRVFDIDYSHAEDSEFPFPETAYKLLEDCFWYKRLYEFLLKKKAV